MAVNSVEYRRECFEWTTLEGEYDRVWSLEPLKPVTSSSLLMQEATQCDLHKPYKHLSVKSALEHLWERLAECSLVALGLDTTGVGDVPAGVWTYVKISDVWAAADEIRLHRGQPTQTFVSPERGSAAFGQL